MSCSSQGIFQGESPVVFQGESTRSAPRQSWPSTYGFVLSSGEDERGFLGWGSGSEIGSSVLRVAGSSVHPEDL